MLRVSVISLLSLPCLLLLIWLSACGNGKSGNSSPLYGKVGPPAGNMIEKLHELQASIDKARQNMDIGSAIRAGQELTDWTEQANRELKEKFEDFYPHGIDIPFEQTRFTDIFTVKNICLTGLNIQPGTHDIMMYFQATVKLNKDIAFRDFSCTFLNERATCLTTGIFYNDARTNPVNPGKSGTTVILSCNLSEMSKLLSLTKISIP